MSADEKSEYLSYRPSGRGSNEPADSAGQRLAGAQFANGTLATATWRNRSTYLTPDRLRRIDESLTDRDRQVVRLCDQFGFIEGRQIAVLAFGTTSAERRAAERCAKRLHEIGVLDRLERRVGGARSGSNGYVYRLGPVAMRLRGDRARLLPEPGQLHLDHRLAIAQVRVELHRAERVGRAAVELFETEPACWRSYVGRHGEPVTLKPDAFAALRLDHRRRRWFIEVDRGTVSTTTVKAKLARYVEYLESGAEQAAHGLFPRVVWTTQSPKRASHLRALFAEVNDALGAELHRLIEEEWAMPP